jgi:inner membrane transporter RhtA
VLAPAAVAVLRMLGAAVVLLAWRRPPAPAWRGARLLRAAAFGLATAGMNIAFYEAIARLPLGTAVAVEFCGPVAVAAVASRRPRDVAAVVLAAVGVALIADVRWSGSPSGVLWALAAAALWAAYIVLGKRVAGVGVLSSVVPYVLDQVVLRRVGQARFAVLLALLPATATIVGLIALRQVPSPLEGVGIAAVVVAVALRSRDGDPAEPMG